jgi:hypothetical protein
MANDNRGVLFKNAKRTTDRQPHTEGEDNMACPHCGVVSEFWLSGWSRTARTGTNTFRLLSRRKKTSPRAPSGRTLAT